jgi:ubiquinone/menaquinone biosynthesis C-methylase UbiE
MNNGNYNNGLQSTIFVSEQNSRFTEQYIALRQEEKRIYTDDQVLMLPEISENHIHASEWKIRKHSCAMLMNYLRKKGSGEILEIGCGNGWLSHKLSDIPGSKVTGIDINEVELEQAQRVFSGKPNLKFIYGDLDSLQNDRSYYDFVVFAASIQYFNSLALAINIAMNQLKEGGEVHIIDSQFYSPMSISDARRRSKEYFSRTGFNEMENHYFHHTTDSLAEFNYTILYNPHSLKNRLLGHRNPFPWIRIIKLK